MTAVAWPCQPSLSHCSRSCPPPALRCSPPSQPCPSLKLLQPTLPRAGLAPPPTPQHTMAFPKPADDSSPGCSTAGRRQAGQRHGCHPDRCWAPSPEGEPLPKGEGASEQQRPPVQNNSHLLVHTANTR